MAKLSCLTVIFAAACLSQTKDPRKDVERYINAIAGQHLAAREQAIAAVRDRADAERRQTAVRAEILKLLNGLPEHRGPLSVRSFGTVPGDGFRIDKITFESLPNFFVTADVYVPTGAPAPFPAVLITPGHEPTAKSAQYNWAVNLARNGILAMAVDPVGQGERLQHYDAELEESKIGQGTGEHGHAAFSTLLIGDAVARYFINDGVRALDYLTTRRDVDAARIGAFGCSGGGTATAYLAALDPRVKAAATACYITSYDQLLHTIGNQEAEQSIPGFLAADLDFADWVELAAPKPYAIVSTTADMFPYAGAKQSFEEAKRFYTLFNAADKIEWITGPGGHGNLLPIGAEIIGFFVKNLKGGAADYKEVRLTHSEELQVTPTGQLSTSLHGETIESISRARAASVIAKKPDTSPATVRAVAGITAEPGPAPRAMVQKTDQRGPYRVDTLALQMEPEVEAPAILGAASQAGRKPALLWLDDRSMEKTAASPDFERLAATHVVLVLQPRGTPAPSAPASLLGPFNLLSLRAMLAGKTLVGLRADDVIRAVNWLTARSDVDPSSITVYGDGAEGVVALHAAAADRRIRHVVVENAPASYKQAVEAPLHRNLAEIAIPGVLKHYDLPDLVNAIQSPRTVDIWNAVDAVGKPLPGSKQRSPRDPLPVQ
ncbi:MAG TPA: acetylxylan esterase [Candidatus Limnocylindrales bacterium]|nr:acetylxylan esterase [Candidatus Limnocylindrales bacterium]